MGWSLTPWELGEWPDYAVEEMRDYLYLYAQDEARKHDANTANRIRLKRDT